MTKDKDEKKKYLLRIKWLKRPMEIYLWHLAVFIGAAIADAVKIQLRDAEQLLAVEKCRRCLCWFIQLVLKNVYPCVIVISSIIIRPVPNVIKLKRL
jgi:hypothetical protein